MNNKLKRIGAQIAVFVLTLCVISFIARIGYEVGISQIWGQIIISIAILGFGWLILSVCHRLMMRTIWKFAAFLILYSLSIWVYSGVSSTTYDMVDLLAPINNTLSLFFPSRGSYNEIADLQKNVEFQYVHLFSYLFFAMIVFSWFGRRLINRTGHAFILPSHKNVFWGYSDGGVLLAKDIIEKTSWQQVIFVLPDSIKIDEDEEKRVFELLDGIGAVVLYKDLDFIKSFPKAHRHFFLTEDQDLNTRMALAVSQATQKTGVSI